MDRRLLLLPALVTALLGATLPAGPAGAATGQPERLCTPGDGPLLSALPDGTLWAATQCRGHAGTTVLRQRPGGAWVTTTASAWSGWRPVAAADDGTSTYVVVQKPGVGAPTDTLSAIGKVPHGGRPSALTSLGDDETAPSFQVQARGGRWRLVTGTHSYHSDQAPTAHIYQTGTLPGARSPLPASGQLDEDPSVALTADGAVIAWVTRQTPADSFHPEGPGSLMTATSGPDGVWTSHAVAQAAGQDAAYPHVVVSGGTTVLSWVAGGQVHLVLGDGPERVLPAHGSISGYLDQYLAASGGLAFVTSRQQVGSDYTDTAVYRQAVTSSGAVSEVELTATGDPAHPHQPWGLTSATAARGSPTAGLVSTRTVFSLSR